MDTSNELCTTCIPKTKDELNQKREQLKDIGIRYIKEAKDYLEILKDVFISNGLGDSFFERTGQAQTVITGFTGKAISEKDLPKNVIEYNILIERETRGFEEYLGQFVPSSFNFISKLLIHVETNLAKNAGKNELDRKHKQALDKLISLYAKFTDERKKFLIADY